MSDIFKKIPTGIKINTRLIYETDQCFELQDKVEKVYIALREATLNGKRINNLVQLIYEE